MRLQHLAAVIPVAAAFAALAGGTGVAQAAPTTCLNDGVCITITRPPQSATKLIDIKGTAASDKIVVASKAAFGNNSLPHITVNGFDTQVDTTHDAVLSVSALGGNDQVSLAGLNTTSGFVFYGSATVDGGSGNDVLTGANRADTLVGGTGSDLLDGAAGNDLLLVNDGLVDTVHGGAGTDTAKADKADKLDGVETVG